MIYLSDRDIEAIAQRVASLIRKDERELVSAKEAAALLGVTPRWMRDNKDSFRYKKTGGRGGGKLLFLKSSLHSNT